MSSQRSIERATARALGIAGALSVMSCSSAPASPAHPAVSSAPRAAPHSDEPIDEKNRPALIVVHDASLGFQTAVSIYRQGERYRIVTERSPTEECPLRRARVVTPPESAALERLMALLDPRLLDEQDPCHKSVRDGASWIVGARVDGAPLWRSRQVGGRDDPPCQAFEEACREVMSIARLTCRGGGCYTEEEAKHGLRCP